MVVPHGTTRSLLRRRDATERYKWSVNRFATQIDAPLSGRVARCVTPPSGRADRRTGCWLSPVPTRVGGRHQRRTRHDQRCGPGQRRRDVAERRGWSRTWARRCGSMLRRSSIWCGSDAVGTWRSRRSTAASKCFPACHGAGPLPAGQGVVPISAPDRRSTGFQCSDGRAGLFGTGRPTQGSWAPHERHGRMEEQTRRPSSSTMAEAPWGSGSADIASGRRPRPTASLAPSPAVRDARRTPASPRARTPR